MRTDRRGGSAMIEFILAMPFLLFIMTAALNVAGAMVAQQRAMAAVRYMAWSDVQRKPQPQAEDISRLFFGGEKVRISYPTPNAVPDSSALGDGLSGFLADFSKTKAYRVEFEFVPYMGKQWCPTLPVAAMLQVDSTDWRYNEASIWKLVKALIGGVWEKIF